ncbi:MAG TPA: hypothetical protein VEY67_05955 [Candidatus Dormibacteraeota bacterium]|nr:hypothetical protein [Candidatus Dormibacteraeota bacterium]
MVPPTPAADRPSLLVLLARRAAALLLPPPRLVPQVRHIAVGSADPSRR